MAYKYTKSSIERFNATYGVKIDLDKILSEVNKQGSYNKVLIDTFTEAYKQAALKDLTKGEDDTLFSPSMFDAFCDSVVNPLIFDTPPARKNDLINRLGLNNEQLLDVMSKALDSLPDNAVDAMKEAYMNQNVRIRDMVKFATDAQTYGKYDTKTVTAIASYAEALKQVNESRSTLWRVLHPFRNRAEQRDAKVMENIVKDRLGDVGYNKAANRALTEPHVNFNGLKTATATHFVNAPELNDLVTDDLTIADVERQLAAEWVKQHMASPKQSEGKESVNVNALKEDPYKNNTENKKIDEKQKAEPQRLVGKD